MFGKLISVGRLTGFVRDVLMAWILGKGLASDAFLFAFLFPNYFRAIFGAGTINPAFLPRYAARYAKGEREAAARFADQIFSWQLAVQTIVLAGALIGMPLLVKLFVPGYT